MSKPIKSRHGLTRCTVCRAHIEAAERPSLTDCPFCGANLLRGGSTISAPGRGGLIAASLLAFSVACGGGGDDSVSSDDTTTEPTGGDEDPNATVSSDDPDQYDPDPADDNTAVAEYGVAADDYEEERYEMQSFGLIA